MAQDTILSFIEKTLKSAGELTLASFGERVKSSRKQERSQIVTDIDKASEALIVGRIVQDYPRSSIIAEESGFLQNDPEDVWIIDPIDGTSNFANGIPWFGVMLAHVVQGQAVSSGIYLPVSREMYLAERGVGAFKNGKKMSLLPQQDLSDVLISYGTDGSDKSFMPGVKGSLFAALLPRVLNLRCTNSAVDYVYAAEGKLGGLINLENRIWDIAPIIPIAEEAGCRVTDYKGEVINLHVDEEAVARNFTLVLGEARLQKQLLDIIQGVVGS